LAYIEKNLHALPQDIIVNLGGADIVKSVNVDLRTFSDHMKIIESRVNSCDHNSVVLKKDIGYLKSDVSYLKNQYIELEQTLHEHIQQQRIMNLKMDSKLDALLLALGSGYPKDIKMSCEDVLEEVPRKKKSKIEVRYNMFITLTIFVTVLNFDNKFLDTFERSIYNAMVIFGRNLQ